MTIALASHTRRKGENSRRLLRLRLGGPIAIAAGAILSQANGPTVCPFRLCTGHACPGCGATRAVGAAVRGDLGLSFRFHPLALLILAQLLVGWVFVAFGRPSPRWERRVLMLLALNGAALLAVWAVRWRMGLLDFVLAN